jgi:predicted nucleotide-binding protein (sugar kinase/HSP70/actin superfamily)
MELLQVENEREITERLAQEKIRLLQQSGLSARRHFQRPAEAPFTGEERGRVTILFGGLTWKHEKFIQAVFQGSGYRCEPLPLPGLRDYHLGRQFSNPGQCNPAYFTVGSLIRYLRDLEERGLAKSEILGNYVFFTSGSCGPCRFGMYESEFRMALENAGFGGFRVLLFSQNDGIKAHSGEPGLKFSVDFGMGILNAFHLGDVVHQSLYAIRPYEVSPGETDRVFAEVAGTLATFLRERDRFEILERAPLWIRRRLERNKKLKDTLNTLGKIRRHLYGQDLMEVLRHCRARIGQIEVDRLRVKPVVSITGEFWAQLTEGDGNFRMFAFLEREGAQVLVSAIGDWVTYLLHQGKANALERKGLESPAAKNLRNKWAAKVRSEISYRKRQLMFTLGERIWMAQYARAAAGLGGLLHSLARQSELAELARPFYHPLARGGEGHIEVGKNVYYSVHHRCHMVLALKPFGCMPSSQSDGVQSAVVARYPEMIFLPIETAGEGEVHAHSRVQMALSEAKSKARAEFERCLEASGARLDDIREYVQEHAELRSALYRFPTREGIAGTAANFILHVGDLMAGKARRARAES